MLYVLPAIVVMLIVIAYPIYYTIDLSFFRTPPGLQLKDKIFVGFDNYKTILTSDVFWTVTWNTVDLDGGLDDLLVRSRALPPRLRSTANSSAAACCARSSSFPGSSARSLLPTSGSGSTTRISASSARCSSSSGSPTGRPNFIDNVSTVLPSLIVVNIWREFSVRDDHDDGRPADRARPAAARRAGSTAPAPGSASGTSPSRT